MRLSHLVASATLPLFVIMLNAAASADPRTVDTRPAISAIMEAQIFPYGVRQGFKVLGDTKGKKCDFTWNLGPGIAAQSVSAVLSPTQPWISDDLKLPTSNGNTYSLVIKADPTGSGPGGANTCQGQVTLSFAVVPETGKLTALTSSAKVVAVNQYIRFTVSGKTFGSCKFNFGLGTQGSAPGYTLTDTATNPLPYDYPYSSPQAGDYFVTADEIDDAPGMPEGCTGHFKTPFNVIPRPACPAANEYYQSADDSEFGCLYSSRSKPTILGYACPTGYDKFQSIDQNVQYGCRKQSSPALALGVIGGLLGGPPSINPALALGGYGGPQADKPTITGAQIVAEPAGNAPRPNINVFYAGEALKIDVAGNLPNKAGFGGNECGYAIKLQDVTSDNVIRTMTFDTFDIHDVGVVAAGNYRVYVMPSTSPGGPPACLGMAEIAKVTIYPWAAWVTNVKLVGFGYHFNAGDAAGLYQFCENCTSIFSPAHNTAFLQIVPTVIGSTPGSVGACAYNITQVGGGQNIVVEVPYKNGQPAVPSDQQSLYSATSGPPFWNKWDGVSNTVTVTISPGNDSYWPTCNILGGKITKTITFTDKTGATVVK